jgi:hypothetical protein
LPMLSPNLWHKMSFNVIVSSCAASNLHKQPKWGSVTYWVIWYLFLGTCIMLTHKARVCKLCISIIEWSAQFHRAIRKCKSCFSWSAQFHRAIRKCKPCFSSSVKTLFWSKIKLIKQNYFQLQHQNHSPISHEFGACPSSMLLISISSQR